MFALQLKSFLRQQNKSDYVHTHTHTHPTKMGGSVDPRWWLEGRSRQHELCKSKILLRHWSHTWQKKTTKKNQNSNTLNPQPVKSFSTPCYSEKTGGLPHHQTPAPNLLGRHPADQQVSNQVVGGITTATPGINQHSPLGRVTPTPQKKNWIIKKELKRNIQQREWCALRAPENGGEARSWSPHKLSVNKDCKGR
jgi:hypothetical protein